MDRSMLTTQMERTAPYAVSRTVHLPLHPALRDAPLDVWHLRRTIVAHAVTRAIRLTGAERPRGGIPSCGFATPVFRVSGTETVVDAAVFSDLKMVRARRAATLGPVGEEVGRLIALDHEPRNVVKLLVHAGVIEASTHAVATIAVMAETRDESGHWFRIISDDRFQIDQRGRDLYAFGVHLSLAGLLRVMNPNALPGG